jgi:hypothetical protein
MSCLSQLAVCCQIKYGAKGFPVYRGDFISHQPVALFGSSGTQEEGRQAHSARQCTNMCDKREVELTGLRILEIDIELRRSQSRYSNLKESPDLI